MSTRIQNNSSSILTRNKNTKRLEKKKIQRREIIFQIINDEIVNRRLLTSDEVINFFSSIIKNNTCVFSIKRLSELLLNERYSPSILFSSSITTTSSLYIDQYKELENKYQEITLLDASCYFNKDLITLSLLKSGAMINFQNNNMNDNDIMMYTNNIQKKLLDITINPSFIVWIVLNYFHFHYNDTTYVCEKCKSHNVQLHLKPCNHQICQKCYWDEYLNIKSRYDDLCCPICDCLLNYKFDTLIISNIDINTNDHFSTMKSLEKWLKLPESIDNSNDNGLSRAEKLKYKSFQALPMSSLQQKLIGTLRSKRCEEFHKAAAINNWKRLKIIFISGVDIDCINEYGMTALFVSTSKKHYESMDVLLSCGANENTPDNAGYIPFDVAYHYNDEISISKFKNKNVSEAYLYYSNFLTDRTKGTVTTLIPLNSNLKGAGSYVIDNFFDETFLMKLEILFKTLPVAPAEKKSCSHRSYYCDSSGWISEQFSQVLKDAAESTNESKFCSISFREMRFLHYEYVGGELPVHVDLARRDIDGKSSTHTFILYLQTNNHGGETILYDELFGSNQKGNPIATVKPIRGRLLIFPHHTPHSGEKTIEIPKLLLRGEMY